MSSAFFRVIAARPEPGFEVEVELERWEETCERRD